MDSVAVESVQGPPLTVVAPASKWVALDLLELWRFRELLVTLGLRDLKLRYRQTFLGVSWVVLQPLLGAGLFSMVFGGIAKMKPDGDVPYFLFSFAGMLGWNAFQTTLTKSSMCLIGNSHLVSKVYFPRIALPISTLFAAMIDFCVALPMLAILFLCYRHAPTSSLLLMPVLLLLVLAMAQGVGLFTSALTVQYRDVQYIMPVLVQFLVFACPIAYSVARIPERLRPFYFLNPLASLLAAFRWSVLGVGEVPWNWLAYSVLVTFAVLIAGAYSFRRMEQRFADVI